MCDFNRGATITPLFNDMTCGVAGCEKEELLARVEPDGRRDTRTLCPQHRVEYLREVYS